MLIKSTTNNLKQGPVDKILNGEVEAEIFGVLLFLQCAEECVILYKDT